MYYLFTNRSLSWILHLVLYLRQICNGIILPLLFLMIQISIKETVEKLGTKKKKKEKAITLASVCKVFFYF